MLPETFKMGSCSTGHRRKKKQTMPRAYDNMPHGQERLRQEEEEGKLPKLLLNSCFARKDGQESARLAEVALFLPSNFLSLLPRLVTKEFPRQCRRII